MGNLAIVETENLSDLVTADKLDNAAIMQMIGQKSKDDSASLEFMPKLSIEHNTEDEEGNSLPRGQWKFKDSAGNVCYAKEVTFRPYIRRYMYSIWDNAERTYSSMSVQAASFGDDFFDTTGGLRCGKLGKKELEMLSPEDPERTLQAGIKCSQVIYGTVTSDEVEEPVPTIWYARGSNFMPASEWIKALEKQGKLLFNTRALLTTLRQKYGGNIYYKAKIDVKDYVEFAPAEDVPLLEKFMTEINNHNSYVEQAYKESRGAVEDAQLVDVLESDE